MNSMTTQILRISRRLWSCAALVAACMATLAVAVPADASLGLTEATGTVANQDGSPAVQAAGHPYEVTTTLAWPVTETPEGRPAPVENLRDAHVELPAGFVGDPKAVPMCTDEQLMSNPFGGCPASTQVGVMWLGAAFLPPTLRFTFRLYNMTPLPGEGARFGFELLGVPSFLTAKVRNSDYGVTVDSIDTNQTEPIYYSKTVFWGVPGDHSHDGQRGECLGFTNGESLGTCPTDEPIRPFMTNPSYCSGAPSTFTVHADSWQDPTLETREFAWSGVSGEAAALTGCESVPFNPVLSVAPENLAAGQPSGLVTELRMPYLDDPYGREESTLRKAVVTLPQGVAVSPSAANGLGSCSPAQIGVGHEGAPQCPDSSKIGSVSIETPLQDRPLTGSIYLATPTSTQLMKVYLVAEGSGVLLKLPGTVDLDPSSGQVTATFDNTPQLPFTDLKVEFFGGPRAALVSPAACGTYETTAMLSSWSGKTVQSDSEFTISADGHGAPCAASGFAPQMLAGTVSNDAGAFSPFTATFARTDSDQPFSGIQLVAPPGALAVLKSVARCDEAQANAGTCGPESLIGHTTVSVGAGPLPYRLGGNVYLTGPYKGAPFGLSIVVPAVAGPFDLGTVVVRAAVVVDPHTAQIVVKSDPLPTILQGVPLDLKSINVTIDRPGFMFNPTSCEQLSVNGTLTSIQGATAAVSNRFQAANCVALKFKPSFRASTSGKTSRASGASLHVTLAYPNAPHGTQANIRSVHVELPKALPSRLSTLNHACPDSVFNHDPASCPVQSRVGFAKAVTPVLPVPLEGPAYFVSHGGQRFPELVVILQGYGVTVYLEGETFISKAGITSSTFKSLPDVPLGSFELTLPQGPFSALTANRDLCTTGLTMPTKFTGQNGAVLERKTAIEVQGCPYALRIMRRSVKKRTLTLKVSVPVAGRLVASGKGVSKAAKTAKRRSTLTLTLKERHASKLRTKVLLRFTPAKGKQRKILRKSIAVTFR